MIEEEYNSKRKDFSIVTNLLIPFAAKGFKFSGFSKIASVENKDVTGITFSRFALI